MSMEGWFAYPTAELPFAVLVLIIAFTVHEFAHAYTAYKFGDNTAYDAGRVTLNPRVHLDVLGMILILLAGFGWAKPVPVNQNRFKHPRLMGVIVTAAGPLSNFVLGLLGIILYYISIKSGLYHMGSIGVQDALQVFFSYFISLNFLLFIFNLIPLPPLDGYRIIQNLVPLKVGYKMEQNMQWGIIIFLLLLFIPPLRAVTISPILNFSQELAANFMSLIGGLFI
ncbi:site-2 protease family protein [Paenibacillus sp. FSL H8-0537]|uniref:site-2 protease family protein n=1 Tax=Paenibacillus sp. FSL H8-0537 TaxID=2921399 RepID=UPI0031017EC0